MECKITESLGLKTKTYYCKSISFIETQVEEAIMRTQGHQGRLLGPARSINLIHSAPEQPPHHRPKWQRPGTFLLSCFQATWKMDQNGQIIGNIGVKKTCFHISIPISVIARTLKRQWISHFDISDPAAQVAAVEWKLQPVCVIMIPSWGEAVFSIPALSVHLGTWCSGCVI